MPFQKPDLNLTRIGPSEASGPPAQDSGLGRLVRGVERFKRGLDAKGQALFRTLADGQAPHTLFITCCDSRINPNLITSTDPGELFIIRNIGNMVAPSRPDGMTTEGAGVEYAVGMLGVREIVLCAHSGCGAMQALLSESLLSDEMLRSCSSLSHWRRSLQGIRRMLPRDATPEEAAKRNALFQMENLKTYAVVREGVAKGSLRLHAWYYDIGEAELEQWDEAREAFVPMGGATARTIPPGLDAGTPF